MRMFWLRIGPALAMLAMLACGKSPQRQLVGTWNLVQGGQLVPFAFHQDGTGTADTAAFRYAVQPGKDGQVQLDITDRRGATLRCLAAIENEGAVKIQCAAPGADRPIAFTETAGELLKDPAAAAALREKQRQQILDVYTSRMR